MKSTMTERDKKLLLGMLIFVIVVAIGYWGIIPQIKKYNKLGSRIDKEEVTQSINEQKVSNLIFVESMCEEYEEKMAENKDKFFDMMTEAEVDFFLTTKAVKHNLEVYSLNIDIPDKPSERMAYIYSDLYNQQLEWKKQAENMNFNETEDDDLLGTDDSKDKKDSSSDDEDDNVDVFGDVDTVGENTDIYAARVTISLGGDEAELKAYLDEIMASDKKILITSFSWGEYKTQKQVNVPIEEIVQAEEKAESETAEETGEGASDASGSTDGEAAGTASNTPKTDIKYELVTVKSLTISMEIYMCDKVE